MGQYLQNNDTERLYEINDDFIINNDTLNTVPYGFELNMSLIPNKVEYEIIKFIQLCKNSSVQSINLDKQMHIILKLLNRTNTSSIKCYDNNDNEVSEQTTSMTNSDIAYILNSNNITFRNKYWKSNIIDSVVDSFNKYYNNNKCGTLCTINANTHT